MAESVWGHLDALALERIQQAGWRTAWKPGEGGAPIWIAHRPGQEVTAPTLALLWERTSQIDSPRRRRGGAAKR